MYKDTRTGTVYIVENGLWESLVEDGKQGAQGRQGAAGSGTGRVEVVDVVNKEIGISKNQYGDIVLDSQIIANDVYEVNKFENKEWTNIFGTSANFPKFNTAFQNFIKGSSDLTIAFIGASHVDGIGSEGNGSNNLRPNRGAFPKFFGEKLKDFLGTRLGVFSTPTDYHFGEWNRGSGWTVSYYLGGTAQGRVVYNNTTSAALTFNSPDIEVDWDMVDVYLTKRPTTGGFVMSATGGSVFTSSTYQSAGSNIAKFTCSAAVPSKNNTFTIAPSAAGQSVIVVGATFYRRNFSKLVIMNCGVGGTSAGDWNNSTGTGLFGDEVSKVAGTSLTFISIGVNDQGNGSPTSAYQNNYQTLVSRLSAYSDVVAMPPFYVGTTDVSSVNSDLNSYRDAIRDNVVGYNKFIDMRSKMQELNIPYANFSNQHPTFTGYRMIADLLWNEMLR